MLDPTSRDPGQWEACQKLWLNVVVAILSDAFYPIKAKNPASVKQAESLRSDALNWLRHRTSAKDRIVLMAGLDPAWFWSNIGRLINERDHDGRSA